MNRAVWALRRIIPIVLSLVLAGLVAPYLSADHFRGRIQNALETALHRKVTIGSAHFNLFTGPGFNLGDVLIDDDPSAGPEPFAHVISLKARIHWTSLFSGRLAFSTLRLEEPTVNLTKTAAGSWNIAPLLRPGKAGPLSADVGAVPEIQVRDGRINFKKADTQSVFYVTAADIDAYPDGAGHLVIRFAGEPARTDRGAQGFGRITGRGLWSPDNRLEMAVQLEKSSLSDLTSLVEGKDLGVHGFATATASLKGPLDQIGIIASVQVADLHRWDLFPAGKDEVKFPCRGRLNVPGQILELETGQNPAGDLPVTAKVRVTNLFSGPRWGASSTFRQLPASVVVRLARQFGATLPPDLSVDGTAEGAVGYSVQNGMQGELAFEKIAMHLKGGSEARVDQAHVVFSDRRVHFGPAELLTDEGGSASMEGDFQTDTQVLNVKLSTEKLSIGELQLAASGLLGANPIPLLENCRNGTWAGSMNFSRSQQDPGAWTGQYRIDDAELTLPGLALPVRLTTATVEADVAEIRIRRLRGRVGPVPVECDYRFARQGDSPQEINLVLGSTQIAQLERVLSPVLNRQPGLLARTFRSGQPAPEWLEKQNLQGTVQVRQLWAGTTSYGSARAQLHWLGAQLELTSLEWSREDARGRGQLTLSLEGASPRYHLTGNARDISYNGGKLDLEGESDASGTGTALLNRMKTSGTFNAHGISLLPDSDVHEISGKFQSTGGSPVSLTHVQALQAGEMLSGQGTAQLDGRLEIELVNGAKQVRLIGARAQNTVRPTHPVE